MGSEREGEGERERRPSPAMGITFTPGGGDHLAILSHDGTVKVWNTSTGSLVADWKDSDREPDIIYSCISCSFIGKKRKKEGRTFLLALGTSAGDVLAIDAPTGERKWTNSKWHAGGTTAICFANNGRTLYTAGTDGVVCELSSETGEYVRNFKASKRAITTLSLSHDEKLMAITSDKARIFTLEDKKEILKFSSDLGLVQHISISGGGKNVISTVFGKKQVQIWSCDQGCQSDMAKVVLSMQSRPVMLECRSYEEDGMVILSVSEKGVAYVWHLMSPLQDGVTPTRILVKSGEGNMNQQKSAKKNRIPIIAAKLCEDRKNSEVSVLVAYGSLVDLQFRKLEVIDHGKDIYLAIEDEASVYKAITSLRENKDPQDVMHAMGVDFDTNEPTMAEKLASLDLRTEDRAKSFADQERPLNLKPPSADSVHLLLKQALHADDHVLLLDCLYTRDEKVIAKSTSLLNPADVLKLLNALVSMIQSRGAVLVCSIPWLKSLLTQHASCIVSQESSLLILNSLFQLIESRISAYGLAVELSTCLDYLFAGIPDEEADEESTIPAIVYEDKDTDEEESEDAMETDGDSEEVGAIINSHDSDGSEVMSDR